VYASRTVLQQLRQRGFIARTLAGYGAPPLPPRRVVYCARFGGR
jgi:hypothetical protein